VLPLDTVRSSIYEGVQVLDALLPGGLFVAARWPGRPAKNIHFGFFKVATYMGHAVQHLNTGSHSNARLKNLVKGLPMAKVVSYLIFVAGTGNFQGCVHSPRLILDLTPALPPWNQLIHQKSNDFEI